MEIDGPGGGRFAPAGELAAAVASQWQAGNCGDAGRLVVRRGGEPLLQIDGDLVDSLHEAGFEVAIETNGVLPTPSGVDWIRVSPMAGVALALGHGDELKLVYPRDGASRDDFEDLDFTLRFLQPIYGLDRKRNTRLAVRYSLDHPRRRLSLQTRNLLGIP